MRDRLVELISKARAECASTSCFQCEYQDKEMPKDCVPRLIADHLLANGVIVPPCKVGDMVYILDVFADNCKCADCDYYYAGGMGDSPECEKTSNGYRYHKCVEIIERRATMQSILCWLSYDGFGKTVFHTREEAEQELKGEHNAEIH
jgi:hypothetical protein